MKLKIYCSAESKFKEPSFGFDSKIEGTPIACLELLKEMQKALEEYVIANKESRISVGMKE